MADYIKKTKLSIGENVSGERLHVTVFNISGSKPDAPSIYIQANMHGAELQGNAVLYQLLEYLNTNQPLGHITMVPQCNPIGLNHKVGEYTQGRFDPITGDNWNRCYYFDKEKIQEFVATHNSDSAKQLIKAFRQYLVDLLSEELQENWKLSRSQYLAYSLQQLAHQADSVLDLHTASIAVPYLYAPSYALDLVKPFDCKYILKIENVFAGALDEACFVPWWTLSELLPEPLRQSYINPVSAFTLELGSQEKICSTLAKSQSKGILAYLSSCGILNSSSLTESSCAQSIYDEDQFITYYAPYGGLYEMLVQPGDRIHKGQAFARCLQLNTPATRDILAPFDGVLLSHSASAALPRGMKLGLLLHINS